MTARYDLIALADPAALLDRAIGFTLGAAHAVTPDRLSGPTPCANWDLRELLGHVTDSLEALCEGLGTGRVGLSAPTGGEFAAPASGAHGAAALDDAAFSVAALDAVALNAAAVAPLDDPVASLRGQAARLRGVWAAAAGPRQPVLIADCPLDQRIVLGVGAVEIAVHGWDICRASGLRRPIPPALAVELAGVCALAVTAETRYPAFAAPVAVPSRACPSDHLVAFLGRDPATTSDPL